VYFSDFQIESNGIIAASFYGTFSHDIAGCEHFLSPSTRQPPHSNDAVPRTAPILLMKEINPTFLPTQGFFALMNSWIHRRSYPPEGRKDSICAKGLFCIHDLSLLNLAVYQCGGTVPTPPTDDQKNQNRPSTPPEFQERRIPTPLRNMLNLDPRLRAPL